MDEFELIQRYFASPALAFPRAGVVLGIGDDAGLLSLDAQQQMAVSMDVLQTGVHFPADADPALLAERALRVNLSDLSAMAAEPLCFTLGLTLPEFEPAWLEQFSQGLATVAQAADCPLLGGDTTRGVLTICIQVHGQVPHGQALRRGAAQPGDDIYVTGTLGDAAAALVLVAPAAAASGVSATALAAPQREQLLAAYYRPQLYLAFAQALRGIANAAIDVSDGLAGDLGHILRASAVDAEVALDALPLSPAFRAAVVPTQQLALAVSGGDDYALCFTAPPGQRSTIAELAAAHNVLLSRIGTIVASAPAEAGQICWRDAGGRQCALPSAGYRHFSKP